MLSLLFSFLPSFFLKPHTLQYLELETMEKEDEYTTLLLSLFSTPNDLSLSLSLSPRTPVVKGASIFSLSSCSLNSFLHS
ncbi:hypothetical protein L2E82_35492 [Cichorium intybus]|uniref:Uncharacterized protein n=1 Tax=Cichorium intybus TaxID=13427 RepID=A0ACB9BNZ9_CICIN|nr:hypothetical protein L2E82_35492 [Cichorium intybus]